MKKIHKLALFASVGLLAVGCGSNTVNHGEPITAEKGKEKFQAAHTEIMSEDFVAPAGLAIDVNAKEKRYLEDDSLVVTDVIVKSELNESYSHYSTKGIKNNEVVSYYELWAYIDETKVYYVSSYLSEETNEYEKYYSVVDCLTEEAAKMFFPTIYNEFAMYESNEEGVIDVIDEILSAVNDVDEMMVEDYYVSQGYSSDSKIDVQYRSKNDKHVYCDAKLDLISLGEDNSVVKTEKVMFELEVENNLPILLNNSYSLFNSENLEIGGFSQRTSLKYNFTPKIPNLDGYTLRNLNQ